MVLGMCIVLFLVIGGCATSPVGADLSPNGSQAVITVVRGENVGASGFQGAAAKWPILIDGVEVGKLGNKGTVKVLVENGQHTVQTMSHKTVVSEIIEFTANSNELIFDSHLVFSPFPAMIIRAR